MKGLETDFSPPFVFPPLKGGKLFGEGLTKNVGGNAV